MKNTSGRILKADDVEFVGRFHLNVEKTTPGSVKTSARHTGPARVQMVENHPEFSVVEITCPCGTKTYLRCEYDGAQAAVQQTKQTETVGDNDNAEK